MSQQALNNQNQYDELSDYENMVDQQQVEPDYYIDRAEKAQFVRDEDGHDKSTMLKDKDELFDFNLESEPLLQVLCGKALEQARVEVIEDYECS